MNGKSETIGTRGWLERVFAAGPARNAAGRSKPTQRYMVAGNLAAGVSVQGTTVLEGRSVAEGGNSASARALLTTMVQAGVVSRIKLEPFALTIGEHGVHAVPDILFEIPGRPAFVVENKASRYLTEAKLQKYRQVEAVIRNAGLTYLFWTDAWPLSPAQWRLVREMRRLGTSRIEEAALQQVANAVREKPKSIQELRALGIYRDTVLGAAWRGMVHFNLFLPVTDATTVSSDVSARGFASVLSAPVDGHNWWKTLARQ